jgi:isoaspartyl peptidase/L-asparaginase-like protein (Ntn-hydrolase superfamily)
MMMTRTTLTLVLATALCACAGTPAATSMTPAPAGLNFGMVIHGGAGAIRRTDMTPEQEAQYRGVLEQALQTGYRILAGGGTSLDAIEATIHVMEDSPLFNAGKGAVFTAAGKNELDASIMDGRTLMAGAVAGVTHVTNPMTNKRFDRVGDAPIIGAGTYANARCGASSTGHGEFFIRNAVAYDICARFMYTNVSLEKAAHDVVMDRLVKQGGEGGIIAMDSQGNYTMPFNSEGMYRGYVGPDGKTSVAIYK